MVMFSTFDEDVDQLPSWQMEDLEKCFIKILTCWHQYMVGVDMIAETIEI